MPLSVCVRRCWDSQLTRRYYPGDQAYYPPEHPLIKAGCFELMEQPKEPVYVAPKKVETVVIPEKPVDGTYPVHESSEAPEVKKK